MCAGDRGDAEHADSRPLLTHPSERRLPGLPFTLQTLHEATG